MQKVVSISLNGNSYQLEEPGYNLLRDYIERAEARLDGSPDRAEVMADLEQAIGEKCRGTLGAHKTVVTTLEVERIIVEMGPVEARTTRPPTPLRAPRRTPHPRPGRSRASGSTKSVKARCGAACATASPHTSAST